MFESLKVLAACDELGIKHGKGALLHIHNKTRGGKELDALSFKGNKRLEDTFDSIASVIPRGLGSRHARELEMFYGDPQYREQMIGLYAESILPRVREMDWGDVVRILFTTKFSF